MDRGSKMERKPKLRGLLLLSLAVALWDTRQIIGKVFVSGPSTNGVRPQPTRNLRASRQGQGQGGNSGGKGEDLSWGEQWKLAEQQVDYELAQERQREYIDNLFPAKDMWIRDEDGTVLKWMFRGARDFWSCFWAMIIPPVSAGFLIVGASSGLGWQIVDLTPWTSENLAFLKSNVFIQWIPQGVFMTFYGFGGLFLLTPLLWFLVSTDSGNGVLRFDKKTELMQIVKNGELMEEVAFEDIKSVRMEWNDLWLSTRELLIVKNDGEEVRWWNEGEKPKEVVERRASDLAEFLDKELTLDE